MLQLYEASARSSTIPRGNRVQFAPSTSQLAIMRLPLRPLSFRTPSLLLLPRLPARYAVAVAAAKFSTSTPRRTETPSSTTIFPSSQPPPPPLQSTSSERPLSTPTPSYAYHVSRTASRNLPVYNDRKSGGTRKLTLIRKVAGDSSALLRDMRDDLSLPDDEIKVNPVTRHIVIKVSLDPNLHA